MNRAGRRGGGVACAVRAYADSRGPAGQRSLPSAALAVPEHETACTFCAARGHGSPTLHATGRAPNGGPARRRCAGARRPKASKAQNGPGAVAARLRCNSKPDGCPATRLCCRRGAVTKAPFLSRTVRFALLCSTLLAACGRDAALSSSVALIDLRATPPVLQPDGDQWREYADGRSRPPIHLPRTGDRVDGERQRPQRSRCGAAANGRGAGSRRALDRVAEQGLFGVALQKGDVLIAGGQIGIRGAIAVMQVFSPVTRTCRHSVVCQPRSASVSWARLRARCARGVSILRPWSSCAANHLAPS